MLSLLYVFVYRYLVPRRYLEGIFIYLGICLYLEGTKVHLRLRLYFNDFLYFVQQPFVVLHDVYHCIYLF